MRVGVGGVEAGPSLSRTASCDFRLVECLLGSANNSRSSSPSMMLTSTDDTPGTLNSLDWNDMSPLTTATGDMHMPTSFRFESADNSPLLALHSRDSKLPPLLPREAEAESSQAQKMEHAEAEAEAEAGGVGVTTMETCEEDDESL